MSSGSFEPDNGYSLDLKGGGVAIDLSIGGTPAPGVVIGGDYIYQQVAKPHFKLSSDNASVEADASQDLAFGLLGIFADWFPDPHGGFHAGATIGYAIFSAVDENGNVNDNTSEKGFGGAFRVGYDFWVADQWSLGLLGQFVAARVSSDEQLGLTEHDAVTSFGLLVTGPYH